MAKQYNILLVEDHPTYRKGLADILTDTRIVNKIGEAETDEEALKILETGSWHLMILDLRLKNETNGRTVLKKMMTLQSPPPVIICSTSNNYADEMQALGAKGYLLKEADLEEIKIAVQIVLNGGVYFSPAVYPKKANPDNLSAREIQVLRLLCLGKLYKEIGNILNISPHTVDYHRRSLSEKTRTDTLAGLIWYANSKGYIFPDQPPF